ncbi:Phosphoacetylglucosamine mutase [Acorus gramineus]|uniref:Phosphoacetylglucosamine mutase n=1 Tax=Acorus gramineus TaxID=55184 RepID=A0AAV9ACN7_ACOGR|nr:Phosphoacetylglucosamine mutase [Acorus gramineus]
MEEKQLKILLQSASRFQPGKKKFLYGTAGFRGEASMLESTVFKAGIMAALRSLKTGLVVGLMITASHNPVSDNGVKIADPSGGMMTQDWEPFADALALAPDPDHLVELIVQFAKKENIPFGGTQSAEILLGRDTRPSGEALLEAAKKGIDAIIGSVAVDMGILTTPQLHWMVRRRNMEMKASEFDYFALLSTSYRSLVDLIPAKTLTGTSDVKLTVDAANGVGGEKIKELSKLLTRLEIEVRNSGKEGEGALNEKVGADYVQKEKFAPLGFGPHDAGTRLWIRYLNASYMMTFEKCASLDGDADRLVYFRVLPTDGRSVDLVDGDKILSLFALFIKEQLTILNKENENESSEFPVKLGIVQTAYANGASTEYLKQLGLDVVFTPTGVKYLHEKALENDIGIYFEANGHGTILFSEAFMPRLESKSAELSSVTPGSEQQKAVLRLLAVSTLINQAVGDALSGLLLVEAILQYLGWSIERWSELYRDLPSRQLKVSVTDRNAVVTTNAETTVVKPLGLQELINYEMAKYPKGRSFIRPSGTEDVIRVYAEASTQEGADRLAQAVAQHVDCFLGMIPPVKQ